MCIHTHLLYWCGKCLEKRIFVHLGLLYSLLFSVTTYTVSYNWFSLFATLNIAVILLRNRYSDTLYFDYWLPDLVGRTIHRLVA